MEVVPGSSVFDSQIVRSCHEEFAVTVTDVMRRRTRLALGPYGGPDVAEKVSHIMAGPLQWDDATRLQQWQAYVAFWKKEQQWRTIDASLT
jgi:glycerol-3-phosphate dehydrogenase